MELQEEKIHQHQNKYEKDLGEEAAAAGIYRRRCNIKESWQNYN